MAMHRMRRRIRWNTRATCALLVAGIAGTTAPVSAAPWGQPPAAAALGDDGGQVGGEGQTTTEPLVVTPGRREGPAFEASGSVSRVDSSKARTMGARTLP